MAAAEILDAIAAQVRVCTKCPLYLGTKNGVPVEGSPEAEVMFIGEGPGYHEDRQGRPFVGPAGAFLKEPLASIRLERSSVLITQVVKHRTPEQRDPLADEIRARAGDLPPPVEALQPNAVVKRL